MEPLPSLQEHLTVYNIRCFGDQPAYESWAEQQLGHRWRQRLDAAYGCLHARSLSREDVRKTFDCSSHTKIAQVNLSGIFPTVFGVGDAIGKLIQDRKRVLDLGCNIGHLTTWYALTDADRHVTAVDFSPPCVHAARVKARKLGLTNVDFEVGDVEACDLTGTYDAVVESSCLKYVNDIGKVLRHLSSLLEPQGILVTTTLGESYQYDVDSLLRSSGLVGVGMHSGDFHYLGQRLGYFVLVARKQAASCAQEYWDPCPYWSHPASSQVILVGA